MGRCKKMTGAPHFLEHLERERQLEVITFLNSAWERPSSDCGFNRERDGGDDHIERVAGDIALKAKSPNENSLVEKVFSTKANTLQSTVRSLLDKIALREQLDLHLLDKITHDLCWRHTNLDHLKSPPVQYIPELFRDVNALIRKVEANILDLEKENERNTLSAGVT